MLEELLGPERRRRHSSQKRIAIVQEMLLPGMAVSHTALLRGVNANQIFAWRKQYQEGSLTAIKAGEVSFLSPNLRGGETNQKAAAPAGQKTMENELLKKTAKKVDSACALNTP